PGIWISWLSSELHVNAKADLIRYASRYFIGYFDVQPSIVSVHVIGNGFKAGCPATINVGQRRFLYRIFISKIFRTAMVWRVNVPIGFSHGAPQLPRIFHSFIIALNYLDRNSRGIMLRQIVL